MGRDDSSNSVANSDTAAVKRARLPSCCPSSSSSWGSRVVGDRFRELLPRKHVDPWDNNNTMTITAQQFPWFSTSTWTSSKEEEQGEVMPLKVNQEPLPNFSTQRTCTGAPTRGDRGWGPKNKGIDSASMPRGQDMGGRDHASHTRTYSRREIRPQLGRRSENQKGTLQGSWSVKTCFLGCSETGGRIGQSPTGFERGEVGKRIHLQTMKAQDDR